MDPEKPDGPDEQRSDEGKEEPAAAAPGEGAVEEASKESFPASDPPAGY